MLTLKVEKRDGSADLKKGREKGNMPAVYYGPKEESTPVSVSQHEFEATWKEAGESTIVELEGVGESKEALIQDVDVHPVSGKPRHADFYVFEKGKKITVSVPLEFVGESPAVEDLDGTLVKVIHELEIEVLPKDLPHEIEVDVSGLVDFESQIAVKDLKLPEGVTAEADSEDIVVSVSEPKEEIEEEPEEIDMDAIEVEGEGKEEGEEPSPEGGEEKKSE